MVAALLMSALLLAGPQAAPAAAQSAAQEELPVSLGRIQRALSEPPAKPAIELKEEHPVFRLEVFGKKPTLEDILGEKFWLGPSNYGSMTHQEFMDKVTPPMLRNYGGFTGVSLLQATALTLAEQWALRTAIGKFRSALTDHEREAARKEVIDAMADLEKARAAAGLPPK
jgi:hypothetical protein